MAPHTYITIEDASTLLDKQYVTVKAASSRGVFTRVPVTSHQQSLVKEQVELFIGKKQLKLAALNREELKKWHEINDAIALPETLSQGVETEEELQIRNQLANLPKLKGMDQTITIQYKPADEREVPKGVPFLMGRTYGIPAML